MHVLSKARDKELGQRPDLPADRRHQVPVVGGGGARGQQPKEGGSGGGADEESLRLGRLFNGISSPHSAQQSIMRN